MPSAYLLISHGSRDPRPARSITQLADRLSQRLSVPVGTAVLECAPTSLSVQIQQFSHRIGHDTSIDLVPLFLLPGVHMSEDIPEQVELARSHTQSQLTLLPHVGSHSGIAALLKRRFGHAENRILLSHGSRRSGVNETVEAIGAQVDAAIAYWLVPPSVSDQIAQLVDRGCQQITILPYFLFSGGITDAIAKSIRDLAQRYSQTNLQLLSPIELSDDLVDLVVELIQSTQRHSPLHRLQK